ncbi:MAG: aldo/keto reductase [Actinobacteria bacterium]|nr:aldo/keto reductase [Actinomycetota bacterium]
MEYRQLGRSGLRISTLTLGTMTFAGKDNFNAVGNTDLEGAKRQIGMALDAGVNLIDTADVYSGGVSEELVGQAIKGKRDDLLLSSKVRMKVGDGPNDAGLSRHHIIEGLEASLRRLQTDHIDIYHVHEWDGQTPVEETLSTLDAQVKAGKIRYLAASNYSGWQLMKALAAADARGHERFSAQQIYYSLEARDAEYELVPLALDQGLGILVWSPLAGGLLSGKFRRDADQPEQSRHLNGWSEPPVRNEDRLYDTIEVLVDVAKTHEVSPAQVALAWLLSRPGVTSLVIGARTDEQLADNLKSADLVLSADERAALDQVSTPDLIYPHWHQANTASERFGAPDLALHGSRSGR